MAAGQKAILVTGATSGIGRAIAERFLADGHLVIGLGRDTTKLSELETSNGLFRGVVWDLASDAPLEPLLDKVREIVPAPIDILVNAAGVIDAKPLDQHQAGDFERLFRVNFFAAVEMCRVFLPQLLSTRGNIMNLSSVAGLRPFPGLSAYCASKAALDHFTRSLAIELAPKGVRVNAVNPGVVVTALHKRGGMSAEAYDAFLERGKSTHPLGRVGTPEEIASLVRYLCSDEASWITGETVAIDGGRHLTALR